MSRAGLTRDLVVRTAAELADAHGLDAATISNVARHHGVKAPSLYSHVAGTADLHAELAALALTELADRGDRALAGRSGHDALAAFADAHRDYAREHPGRFEAAGRLGQATSPSLAEPGARVSSQSLAVLRGYDVPEPEQVHAVRLLASVVRGFVELEAGGAFAHIDPPAEESWRRALDAIDLVLRGLAPRPSTRPRASR